MLGDAQIDHQLHGKPVRQHDELGAALGSVSEQSERAVAGGREVVTAGGGMRRTGFMADVSRKDNTRPRAWGAIRRGRHAAENRGRCPASYFVPPLASA